ncbi:MULTISPECIES: hypothetical protein [Limnobacter]|uniref:Uncharacterized protein n=1 Tax=Limnobacter litoralis TaxID=481366 RepID=A0ABQ5YQS2_9BURK|nr:MULTISPECIES: hypothetical protein [Limnobacter]GLR25792.1 hypothetical protein GCM10007875_08800 [Limnobacter litoralis]HEX5487081.1 hypothetical protein [Limnobacter sp.]
MSQKRSVEPHLRGLVDLISASIDEGTRQVESVHRRIADIPFSVLGKIKPIAPVSSVVHMIEKKITHSAYDTVRFVSKVGAQAVHNALPTDPVRHGISKPDYLIDHEAIRQQTGKKKPGSKKS